MMNFCEDTLQKWKRDIHGPKIDTFVHEYVISKAARDRKDWVLASSKRLLPVKKRYEAQNRSSKRFLQENPS